MRKLKLAYNDETQKTDDAWTEFQGKSSEHTWNIQNY